MTHIGWLRLTHILDGVLHGDIELASGHAAEEVLGRHSVLEVYPDAHRVTALGLTLAPGMFGPITGLEDLPLAYPRTFQTLAVTEEMLTEMLKNSKEYEAQGCMAPVYLA